VARAFFRGIIAAVFSAASRASSLTTSAYRSAVIAIELCRSIAETTLISTPAASACAVPISAHRLSSGLLHDR
jgi:hypothetical protein